MPKAPDLLIHTTVVVNSFQANLRQTRLGVDQSAAIVDGARCLAAAGDESFPTLQPIHIDQIPDTGLGGVVLSYEVLFLDLPSLQLSGVELHWR